MMPDQPMFTSVWDALEDSPAAAENMRLRSELMIAIQQVVADWSLTQVEAAKRLELTQPRLNDLIKGRVGKFSLDALITISTKAGLIVRIEVVRPAA